MNHEALRWRARLNTLIRVFFAERGVIEVETPILSRAGNTDPNIESFTTAFAGHVDAGPATRWLRTSPEFPLKRLLASGFGDCYELGRVFRNGEAGNRHNPEFTMLEWYRVGFDHIRLGEEVIALVTAALALAGRRPTVIRQSYRDWFVEGIGIDPLAAPVDRLQAALGDIRVDGDGLGRDDWLDLLVTHRLCPGRPADELRLVFDYPASQCALARIRPGDPPVAERFELLLGGTELANGYHELTDAAEQRARFERDHRVRAARGLPCPAIDEALLQALPRMPACAGVALGVDRLLLSLLGTDDLRTVLAFPFHEA